MLKFIVAATLLVGCAQGLALEASDEFIDEQQETGGSEPGHEGAPPSGPAKHFGDCGVATMTIELWAGPNGETVLHKIPVPCEPVYIYMGDPEPKEQVFEAPEETFVGEPT